MKLRIDAVSGHGNASQEVVTFTVLEDCDLAEFVLADSTYFDNGNISNRFRHTYWFLRTQAKTGDRVALWTRKGTNGTVQREGATWHVFHWNSDAAVWNDAGDAAVLLHVDLYTVKKARP